MPWLWLTSSRKSLCYLTSWKVCLKHERPWIYVFGLVRSYTVHLCHSIALKFDSAPVSRSWSLKRWFSKVNFEKHSNPNLKVFIVGHSEKLYIYCIYIISNDTVSLIAYFTIMYNIDEVCLHRLIEIADLWIRVVKADSSRTWVDQFHGWRCDLTFTERWLETRLWLEGYWLETWHDLEVWWLETYVKQDHVIVTGRTDDSN